MPVYLTTIKESDFAFDTILETEFKLSASIAKEVNSSVLRPHLKRLRDDISLVVETHYIDKVYRDSYYEYYSSKLGRYKRNCIKVSLFEGPLKAEHFKDGSALEDLQEKYLGFFVLRPTYPDIMGRSVVSPKALRTSNIEICAAQFSVTAYAIRFKAIGFPYASQDGESITCAETTIWSLMEYFGHKYPDYRPVLPSKIHNILNSVSYERLLPSSGLDVNQMSYALRELGFGTHIYARRAYGAAFEMLLSVYIESGIPLVIAVDNRFKVPASDYIGHALLCIGRVPTAPQMIDGLSPLDNPKFEAETKNRNIKIFDFSAIKHEYVFIDDNCPAYQTALLESPAAHYDTENWRACEISHFIVPLYKRIYFEAYKMKNFVLGFLLKGPVPIRRDSEMTIRSFLASTRSYKHYIATTPGIPPAMKDVLTEEKMPKFLWVTELSSKDLLKQGKATGLILLDPTEPNVFDFNPLITAFYEGFFVKYSTKDRNLEKFDLPLSPFVMYQHNLKRIV